MKKNIVQTALFAVILLLSSCAKTEFEAMPEELLMGDSLITNYSIEKLIADFDTTYDAYSDTVNYKGGLFTVRKIESATPVVISGIVTSTDVEGNVYKFMTIQETGANGRAMKISIDASGLSAHYPLGKRVWIQCNNLYLGKYAQSYQLGMRYENLEKFKVKKSKDTTIYRVEPGRIPMPIALNVIHAYGRPVPEQIKPDTLTIAQIKAGGVAIVNKLVVIRNAYFTGKGADFNKPALLKNEADYIFAPSTNGVGYPQSREITDGSGSIFVSTSEFSKFAKKQLPSSQYIGEITALVGWYNDKKLDINPTSTATNDIYHQLTLRKISDLGKGFEGYHESLKNN